MIFPQSVGVSFGYGTLSLTMLSNKYWFHDYNFEQRTVTHAFSNNKAYALNIYFRRKDAKYGEHLLILKAEEAPIGETLSLKEVFRYDMKDINPWKVQTCDVDGDGRREISIGVYKKARFHSVMAKRPFIYSWHGNGIFPKWLGSRLARPFTDYIFCDITSDGRDELISIEYLEDDRKSVHLYGWKGFGFEGLGESEAYDDILEIKHAVAQSDSAAKIQAHVVVDRNDKWIALQYADGKLLELKE